MTRAHRFVCKWRRRLRLHDWTITVERSTVAEIDALADALIDVPNRAARIRVASDGRRRASSPYDLEQVVVHELVHIPLEWMREALLRAGDKTGETLLDQTVDALAWALVEADKNA